MKTRGSPTCKSPPLLTLADVLRFSWTHLQELIRIDDPWKRAFYENECLKSHWSVRQLQRQISSLLYERTGLSTNWFMAHMMAKGDRTPVGILLCSDWDGTEVEFATAGMDNRLFVSRYLTALPSAEKLRAFLEADRERIERLLPRLASARKLPKRTRPPG